MFFGHCHRTRFRDSFCLASVFEMTVYLLAYLLPLLLLSVLINRSIVPEMCVREREREREAATVSDFHAKYFEIK